MNEEEEKKKTCFLLFYDWEPLLRMLPREDIGDLLLALYDYEVREQTPPEGSLSPLATNLFVYLSKLFDENKKLWYDKRKAGSKGGKKSAESKQTSSNTQANPEQNPSRPQAEGKQIQPKDKDKDKDKDKVSPNGDSKRECKRESDEPIPSTLSPDRKKIPPKIEWVKAYFVSIGSTEDEADKFFDYWEARGWKNKSGLMRDWQAAARTWVRNAGTFTTTNLPTPRPTVKEPELSNEEIARLACMDLEKGASNGVHNDGYYYGNILPSIPESV